MAMHADEGFYFSVRNGYEKFELTKQQFQAYFKMPSSERPKFTYQIDEIKVTAAGADTAIANYKIITKVTGSEMTRGIEERYTNVFAKRDGRWKLIAEHSSDIPRQVSDVVAGMPVGWTRTPLGNAERYAIRVDSGVKHGGNASASLSFLCGDPTGFGSLAQSIAAERFLGKRVRLSCWLKTASVFHAALFDRAERIAERLIASNDRHLHVPPC